MAANVSAIVLEMIGRDEASRSINRIQSSIIRLVGAVASLNAAFKLISFPVKQSIEFERALTDVQKTTGFTDDSISQLSVSLRRLATITGVTAVELAQIAAAAGQLGLGVQGQEAIVAFTDTVARFATVADLSVDQAAVSIAKITNLFQIPIDQAENVSAAFNELSNTTVATGEQLIDIVRRIGSAGGLLEFADATALAAAALELGQTPEVAGTAISKAFANAQISAEKFAQVVGISTDEWTTNLKENGLDALRTVFTALSELDGVARANAIRDLFGGGRQFAFASRLVEDAGNNFRILGKTVEIAGKSFREGTSAVIEFNKVQQSTERQLEVTKRQFEDLAISAGDIFLPAVNAALAALQEFASDEDTVNRIEALAENLLQGAVAIVEFGDAIGDFIPRIEILLSLLGIFLGVQGLKGVLNLLVSAGKPFSIAIKGFVGLRVAMLEFNVAVAVMTGADGLALIPRALAAVRAGVATFTTSLVVAARASIAFLLTPAGIIITLIAGLGALALEVSGAFDFISELFDTSINTTRTKSRALLKELREGSAAFREAINANSGTGVTAIDINPTGDVVAQLTKQVTLVLNIQKGIRGATAEQVVFRNATEDLTGRIIEANIEAERLTKELAEGKESLLPDFDRDDLVRQIKEQEALAARLRSASDSIRQRFERSGEGLGRLFQEGAKGLQDIAGFLTSTQIDALETELSIISLGKKISSLDTDIKELLEPSAGEVVTNEELRKVKELELTLQKLTDELTEVQKGSEEAGRALKNGLAAPVFDSIKNASAAALDDIVDGLRRAKENGNDLEVNLTKIVQKFRALTATLVEAERTDLVLKRLADSAEAASKTIEGVFDNLPTQLRAIRARLDDFNISFARIATSRTVQLKVDLQVEQADAVIDREIKRINERFDRGVNRVKSSNADSGVQQVRIARLERERDALLETQAVRKADNQIIARFNTLQANREVQLKRLNALSAEAAQVEKELIAARLVSGAEGTRQQTVALQKLDRVNQKIVEQQNNVESSTLGVAEFNERLSLTGRILEGLSDPEGFFLTKDELRDLGAEAETAIEKSIDASTSALLEGKKVADSVQNSLESLREASTIIDRTEVEMQKLAKQFSLTAKDSEKIKDNVRQILDDAGALASQDSIGRSFRGALIDIELATVRTAEAQKKASKAVADIISKAPIDTILIEKVDSFIREAEGKDPIKIDIFADINEIVAAYKEGAALGLTQGAEEAATDIENQGVLGDGVILPIEPELQISVDELLKTDEVRKIAVELLISGGTLDRSSISNFSVGGRVSGPGTGTSDSILARVSTGEFIMDALTTRKFGSAFFTSLQALARRGGNIRVPQFASGGSVGDSGRSPSIGTSFGGFGLSGLSAGAGGIVTLRLDLGDEQLEFLGDRADVNKLVSKLKNVNRGGLR